ncbi:hypothetical protein AAG906_034159 [Vitis piasezkii]
MSASRGKDSVSMKSVDQRERMMTRRLKNRERQRRYRARKRLQADMERGSILNQSSPVPVELQLNEMVEGLQIIYPSVDNLVICHTKRRCRTALEKPALSWKIPGE